MMSCCYFILFVMLTTSNWAVTIKDNKIILQRKEITLKDNDMIQIGETYGERDACYQLKTDASLTSATAKRGCIYQRIDCTTGTESSGAATDKDLTDILNRFEHIQIIPRFQGTTLIFRLRILLSKPKPSIRHMSPAARLERAKSMPRIEELSKLKEHSLPLGECPIDPPYDSSIVDAVFRVVDYKKSKLTGKGLRAAPTESFQLELTEFMRKACGDLIKAIFRKKRFYPEGKPGKLIKGAMMVGLEKEAGLGARERFGSRAEYRTTHCMRLGDATTFVTLAIALGYGLVADRDDTHTKLNYVITNINGEEATPEGEGAHFVWRFMHSTGGKVSDVRAKHWILNEENLGQPLLSAGEMMIYTTPEVLHPFTPVILLMDSCSGTFKPSITDEMIGLFQNMFGFTQRYDDLIFADLFEYTVLTPPKGEEKYGIFSVIMIRDALDESRKGKDNCVRKWIEHFDIKMQT